MEKYLTFPYFTDKWEDLIKEDENHLNEVTRNIKRHMKERMELRRILSITRKLSHFLSKFDNKTRIVRKNF